MGSLSVEKINSSLCFCQKITKNHLFLSFFYRIILESDNRLVKKSIISLGKGLNFIILSVVKGVIEAIKRSFLLFCLFFCRIQTKKLNIKIYLVFRLKVSTFVP